MKTFFTHTLFLTSAIILTACGGGGDSSGTNNQNNPTGTGSISLQWDIPATKANGDALSLSEIKGYKIYLETSNTSYPSKEYIDIQNSSTTDYTLGKLGTGTYYVYLSTYDVNGDESSLSDPVKAIVSTTIAKL